MMTNKEHNDNWLASAKALQEIPGIADSLRRANGIAILKELWAVNAITREAYVSSLMEFMKLEKFKLDPNDLVK